MEWARNIVNQKKRKTLKKIIIGFRLFKKSKKLNKQSTNERIQRTFQNL